MRRGEIWWASLAEPRGSEPGYRRPVVIVQANPFNRSRMQTLIVAVVTTNLRLAAMPGNVQLRKGEGGLARPSVIMVTQLLTVDKSYLNERLGALSARRLTALDAGLRLALSL